MQRRADRRPARLAAAMTGVLLALGLAAAPAAPAQGSATGTFSISPARRNIVARPPASLVPTRVGNTTKTPYEVRAFAVLLRQDLSGAFQFGEAPLALATAARIVRVSPARFLLAPGRSRSVALRWQTLPLAARTAYIGVVFQGQAQLPGKRQVPVITRLLSTNFLRLPGRYRLDGRFTALHAIQFAPRALRLLARVKNTGTVIGVPRHGRIAVRDAAGRVVLKRHWTGDVILPGAQREFPIDIRKVLPAGRYTATAAMSFGAHHNTKISTRFRLVGPNQLPTPGVRIAGFAARAEVGDPAHVSARVQSIGTDPVSLRLRISLFRVTAGLAGRRPLSSRRVSFLGLAPKSERPLELDLPGRLTKGQYRVVARYTDPTGATQELTSDFAAVPRRSFLDRLKLFFDRHSVELVIAAVALVLLLLLVIVLRRQRRLKAELRAARASPGRADER